MSPAPADGRPIFLTLAGQIADDILAGVYPPGAHVPSTNELSVFYKINPATAGKALNRLVDQQILEKRRGLGMFVTETGVERLREQRRTLFAENYLAPLLEEAERVGLSTDDIITLIHRQGPGSQRPAI
ncbi:GntR family transcriptional regulator [Acidipropionibacterium virtanenii]|uniref:HTH-type transcriptional repressor YtrA n=1 Tax=Acidipropionibacterium virtanenii TaxID=2057246 RepID=A0A344UPR5_9ACTN|nr:GntR family transcriptional regulator [Acidipropionibacterium virtanenii]AXE37263.1 HTH-type transcriptional repressor YtrA [Acidipropionibacterium virtanenii]